jgi:hypothetical protein
MDRFAEWLKTNAVARSSKQTRRAFAGARTTDRQAAALLPPPPLQTQALPLLLPPPSLFNKTCLLALMSVCAHFPLCRCRGGGGRHTGNCCNRSRHAEREHEAALKRPSKEKEATQTTQRHHRSLEGR